MREQGRLETELSERRTGVDGVGDHDELVLPVIPTHLFAALVGPALLGSGGGGEGGREGKSLQPWVINHGGGKVRAAHLREEGKEMRKGGREGGKEGSYITFNRGTISCAVAPKSIPTFPA